MPWRFEAAAVEVGVEVSAAGVAQSIEAAEA
jgi:hypothetical protein